MKNKILSIFIAMTLLFILTPSVNAAYDGAQKIFLEIGMDMPADWSEMTRVERHNYFKNLGIQPSENGKYSGKAGDLTEYFSSLGLERPDNWGEMEFNDKKKFISTPPAFSDVATEAQTIKEETLDRDSSVVPTEPTMNKNYFILLLSFFALLLILNANLKIINTVIYYFTPIGLLVISLLDPTRDLFSLFGKIAEVFLIFILFIKPIAVIFKSKKLLKIVEFRRQIGILSFWLFLFHAAGLIFVKKLSISSLSSGFLLWGSIAGIGMFILALTSNNYSIKLLKNNWKNIQRLAYPVLFATLIHTSLKSQDGLDKFYIIFSIFIILKILQYIISKKRNQ